jgi:hypothetical protein
VLVPKLLCRCGYVHDLSPIPDAGWLTVRDAEYEELLAVEAERAALGVRAPSPPAVAFSAGDLRVVELCGRLYECPTCGRLLWCQPGSKEFRVYAPEPPVA